MQQSDHLGALMYTAAMIAGRSTTCSVSNISTADCSVDVSCTACGYAKWDALKDAVPFALGACAAHQPHLHEVYLQTTAASMHGIAGSVVHVPEPGCGFLLTAINVL